MTAVDGIEVGEALELNWDTEVSKMPRLISLLGD